MNKILQEITFPSKLTIITHKEASVSSSVWDQAQL